MHRQAVLRRQIERLTQRLQRLERLSNRLSTVRLIIVVVGLFTGVLAFTVEQPSVFLNVACVALLIFILLVVQHNRVKRGIRLFERWRQIKESHLARMTWDWSGLPPAVQLDPYPDEHPFEFDLDVTGNR